MRIIQFVTLAAFENDELPYKLSFRDLVEIMEERGLAMRHTTIMRGVHRYVFEAGCGCAQDILAQGDEDTTRQGGVFALLGR